MEHMNVPDELVKALLEGAAWDSAGVKVLTEKKEEVSEEASVPGDVGSMDTKPSPAGTGEDDQSGTEIVTGKDGKKSKKGDKAMHKESVDVEDDDLECPLCESQLDEPLSEEKMEEHINMIQEILNEVNEESEEDEEDSVEEDAPFQTGG